MQIFLMRHGEAVPPSGWGGPDTTRPLSPIGEAKLEALTKEMKRAGFSVSCVLTSPYDRAQQTAIIVSKEVSLPAPIVCTELSAGAHNDAIRKTLMAYADKGSMLVVGHMPEIAIFGSRVTTEPSVMDKGFEPAEILAMEVGTLDKWGDGRVLWWRKPADWKKAGA